MKILGCKSGGHDGSVCFLDDGELIFSIEAEKDDRSRYGLLHNGEVESICKRQNAVPQIVCGDSFSFGSDDVGKYIGISFDDIQWSDAIFDGQPIQYASVPHELSHICSALALSDVPIGQACYVLIWEGFIGHFYHVDESLNITRVSEDGALPNYVGMRYILPYHGTGRIDAHGHPAAGKIMAIAGMKLGDVDSNKEKEIELAKLIASADMIQEAGRVRLNGSWKLLYEKMQYLRGVDVLDPRFISLCRAIQDELFDAYFQFAKKELTRGLPLIVAGGCGLNCEWNTQWQKSGLFESVFVPPVPNDTGIAIGAAAAIQYLKTGKISLNWDVYCGEKFVHEIDDIEKHGFTKTPLDLDYLCDLIFDDGHVVAWVQGKYEIGPRALCHRSLIASPLTDATRDKLNTIKKREFFRPVAPVCLEEDVSELFDCEGASPYMLFFQKVLSPNLKAVTHSDGTARVQTMNKDQDSVVYELLQQCKKKTGYGVLCNTSLNFPGKGFINRTSGLLNYIEQTGISVFVIDDFLYQREA
ncbi:MAG: putative NodU family carbamoyl transferase [Flavobacteriales bacterium]|jgi:predicted NodU family carbamoyl transferase